MTIDPRLIDRAKTLLAGENTLDNNQRADLWEHYYDSRNAAELAGRIKTFGAPQHVKDALVRAKHISQSTPLPDPVERVVRTLVTLYQLPEAVKLSAEKHPALTKALIDAALKGKQ